MQRQCLEQAVILRSSGLCPFDGAAAQCPFEEQRAAPPLPFALRAPAACRRARPVRGSTAGRRSTRPAPPLSSCRAARRDQGRGPEGRGTARGTARGGDTCHCNHRALSASPAGGIAFAARGEWGGAVPALPAPPSPVGPFGEVRDPEEAEVLRRAKGRECSQIQLGEMGCRWLQTGGWCIISLVRPGVHLSLVGEGREPGGVSAMTLQTVAPPGPRAAY